MTTTVRTMFKSGLNSGNVTLWADRCTWVRTHCSRKVDCAATVYHHDLIFEDEKDALMFVLRWGGRVVDQSEQTVEYVGSLFG